MASYSRENTENNIFIIRSENVDNYTDYVIEVRIGGYHWMVNHRYSEFHELNEQLVAGHGIEKKLLPPKKAFGNSSESFIQKRRTGLERYLQLLLKLFERVPFQLALFLDFQKYEINGVTQILAETLYSRGDALLEKESTCSMDPLQLYAITHRMTKPETVVSDRRRDIGHILDFITRLNKLRIIGTDKLVGTSNINMNTLEFSLAMFKHMKYLELVKCNITRLNGLDHIRQNLEKLKIKKTLTSIQEFLMHNVPYWEEESGGENPNVSWPKLSWVDMSENSITELPTSMRYLERMEYLDLHDNYLETIQNLEAVSYLTHLDVSANRIECLSDLHLRLGNVKSINLAGNKLETLEAFSKLYSLEYLDVSNNQISQVVELKCLGTLPLLETLILTGNPVTVIPDYRIQVLKLFIDRAKEVNLDNKKGTELELDTIAVLLALARAKQPSNSKQQVTEANIEADVEPAAVSSAPAADSEALSKELDAPVLQQKLEDLRKKAGNQWLTQSDEVLAETGAAAAGPRFDSPFNSPTQSSPESEQPFHSLCSTPRGDTPNNDENVDSGLATTDNRMAPDGASNSNDIETVADEAASNVSSPSATYSVNSGSHEEELRLAEESEQVSPMVAEAPEVTTNGAVDKDSVEGEVSQSPVEGEGSQATVEKQGSQALLEGEVSPAPVEENGSQALLEGEVSPAPVEENGPQALAESLQAPVGVAKASPDVEPLTINLDPQATEEIKRDGDSENPPLSPVNVSIDVVDHLEKCLAKLPNTIKLESVLDRLTHIDGEELLNLFYLNSVIRRVGNSKEELCHAMWTSLVTYNNPDLEQPCLVLLSNQATYFVRAGKDHGKYTVTSICHGDLKEVSVGCNRQSVRLGGETLNDYYCCVTRDPTLVSNFVTRITFIVDTDYIKPLPSESESQSDTTTSSDEEESIYDTKKDVSISQSEHPSGVRFIDDDESSLTAVKEFLAETCEVDPHSLTMHSVDFIHTVTADDLHSCTLVLTGDALYLVQESYALFPVPECVVCDLSAKRYCLERVVSLSDILDFSLRERGLLIDFSMIGAESLTVRISSQTLADQLYQKLLSIFPEID